MTSLSSGQHFIQNLFPQEKKLMDLVPYQFGYEKCLPSHSFGPAVRMHYLFHYVISGRGVLFAGEHKDSPDGVGICAGQGFMIFPGQVCTYTADNKEPWEYVWLEFDGLRAREIADDAKLSETEPVWKTTDMDAASKVKQELLYLAHHGDESPFVLAGHAYIFAAALTRPNAAKSAPLAKDEASSMRYFYAGEARAFVERNYASNISVSDMAANCRLNRSYFERIFREEMGISPQEFLIRFRMSRAETLLAHTNKAIGEIASNVGYNDQLAFSRAFRKMHGMPPKEWRVKQSRT